MSVDADPADPIAPEAEQPDPGLARVAAQQQALPPAWRAADRALIKGSEVALVVIGVAFVLMITLQVVSRYLLSFSISFIDSASRMLLVWFFVLGAGVALRRGAHVGFDLLLTALPAGVRRGVVMVSLVLTAAFCAQMLWSGLYAMGPAIRQTDPGLDISLGFVVAAVPVGFGLLVYHALVLLLAEVRGGAAP